VSLLESGALLLGDEGQQRRHRLGRGEVAVDPRHVEPTDDDPLAGRRVQPGDIRGLDQPLTGHGVAADGQPLERRPVQPCNAKP
jgi:hypothetical protein